MKVCVEGLMIGLSQTIHDDRPTYHGLEAV
jgi:hypothetical protein